MLGDLKQLQEEYQGICVRRHAITFSGAGSVTDFDPKKMFLGWQRGGVIICKVCYMPDGWERCLKAVAAFPHHTWHCVQIICHHRREGWRNLAPHLSHHG